ncbi:hypothetical protein [Aristophania vespae]|uniref:hypothetical protein n=1 Tax=Aristophania vespae TaxID=2697033 RepID=UPI0023518B72|nr:hypothetical protein [Aristophania vespae]UMM63822.1 hypothetical protein DM15PD_07990 [Aristophania vespae]
MVGDIPPSYPDAILKGDVLTELFEAVQARLKLILPESAFAHTILPPSPTKQTLQATMKNGACVALGFAGWHRNENAGAIFRGDAIFPLSILLTHVTSRDLYLGTGQLRGMGVTGVMAAIAGGMHSWEVPTIGTCRLQGLHMSQSGDWFEERSALITAELIFNDVSLGNAETLALLEDFITLQSKITTVLEKKDE